ncbi:unnamed protein product [Protopolystoma xenopodis]|uniref:Uncharacterized protein n=1 Tax=Protopolystoma xenopodis TaxID=117903 RepID=A0A3S5AWZ1_9PLAT|nr:unnamed protein product [Protopolystoma xenopodis]
MAISNMAEMEELFGQLKGVELDRAAQAEALSEAGDEDGLAQMPVRLPQGVINSIEKRLTHLRLHVPFTQRRIKRLTLRWGLTSRVSRSGGICVNTGLTVLD